MEFRFCLRLCFLQRRVTKLTVLSEVTGCLKDEKNQEATEDQEVLKGLGMFRLKLGAAGRRE